MSQHQMFDLSHEMVHVVQCFVDKTYSIMDLKVRVNMQIRYKLSMQKDLLFDVPYFLLQRKSFDVA